jgi:hypothetical protein
MSKVLPACIDRHIQNIVICPQSTAGLKLHNKKPAEAGSLFMNAVQLSERGRH